jgi:glutaminyl-tRNA synthetase
VKDGHVKGWDDPRLPTIRGFRRRGYTADAINDFCNRIGVTRTYNMIELSSLDQCVREDLDIKANRAMAILEPLKVTIINFEGSPREVEIQNHPKENRGTHKVIISKVMYIEQSDFRTEDSKVIL